MLIKSEDEEPSLPSEIENATELKLAGSRAF